MPKFDTETAWQFKEATKQTPDHARNIWLVFAMAFGSGLTVMFGAWLIALGLDTDRKFALAAGGLAVLAVWAWWLFKAESLLWTIETVTGTDIDRDGFQGLPPQYTQVMLPTGPMSLQIAGLPFSPELIRDWCRAAWNGQSVSFAAWKMRFSLPDGSKGEERYRQFRDFLVGKGYAEEVGGPVGFRILWGNQDAVSWIGGFAHSTALPGADESENLLPGG